MWASVDTDNNVTKVYTRPTAITYGDVNYPQNVMSSWSNEELATILVYPVVEDSTNYEDPSYYINTNETFTYYDSVAINGITYTNTVVGAYGTATPHVFGRYTTNPITGETVTTPGLKIKRYSTQNQQAYGFLTA
jgi:S-adenosylmethionine synthetase